MIMDVMRGSGYVTSARLRQDSDDTVSIRWYQAAPGAKVFPGPHAFGQTIWEQDYGQGHEGIGEVGGPRYIRPLLWRQLPGQSFDGKKDWFLNGVPREHWNDPPAACQQPQPIGELLIEARIVPYVPPSQDASLSLALDVANPLFPSTAAVVVDASSDTVPFSTAAVVVDAVSDSVPFSTAAVVVDASSDTVPFSTAAVVVDGNGSVLTAGTARLIPDCSIDPSL